ncbi:MAG: GPW/gp25 family protein [Lachnospiraceae bacterium]|nr:GPW/gp25 family protein [Lachnospiraceae bacterium]
MADDRFLGTGCKFPVSVDPATGRFVTVSGNMSVKESLYLILMTQRSERLVRPNFGSDIMNYTFMDTSVTMMSILKRDITQTIRDQEPRISDLEITTDFRQRQGVIIINLEYMVAGSNTRDNMVFPFYLDRGAGEEEEVEADIINDEMNSGYYEYDEDL